ncbi:DNA mismatch repair protein MutS [Cetobacterium sp. 2A]|uniref:lysine 5,6-aminomutase reactivase ATPase KamC n=2 Tax=unclassified Cetobacterium TaxID=2630983 RepID=UPI00163C3D17|nr:DNA mismatch repair protein MutS [Cetobacterium sp. 2A]MBC2857261.1 DNA mismatch repair protein MutS [Cetobacterium sp. 2A]
MTTYEKIGLDYILNNLNTVTLLGKKKIKNLKFLTDSNSIENEYYFMEEVNKFITENKDLDRDIKRKLLNIKDITNTIDRLAEGYILDDIELFEIKIFAMSSQELYKIIGNDLPFISPKNLEKVVEILDPEKTGIASFHIYSSYSPELYSIREEIKREKDNESLYEREMIIEDRIRKELSKKLRIYKEAILASLEKVGHLDLILAKLKQNQELELKKPIIGLETKYKEVFNPKVLKTLENSSRSYQKIDLEIGDSVTVITGANMSGKTLSLKTLALCQYMCQLGFFIPATSSEIKLVDEIYLTVGDFQSLESGLSSYAAEMLELNRIILFVRRGVKPLILIDELARTTNPQEGRAIVQSVIQILKEYNARAIITTHYDKIGKDIKRLRVKGLKHSEIPENISEKNIENYIDYSLIEDNLDKVPEEALSIAKLLNIDEEIIKRAYGYLKGGNTDV